MGKVRPKSTNLWHFVVSFLEKSLDRGSYFSLCTNCSGVIIIHTCICIKSTATILMVMNIIMGYMFTFLIPQTHWKRFIYYIFFTYC